MIDKIQTLRKKLKYHDIDGYVVPRNDDYFTEYSKINRLKIISNFKNNTDKLLHSMMIFETMIFIE